MIKYVKEIFIVDILNFNLVNPLFDLSILKPSHSPMQQQG